MQGTNDPFEQMEAMFEQMRRSALGSLVDQSRPSSMGPGRMAPVHPDQGAHDAALTLEESDDGHVVLADLPGFEREEIDLTFDDGILSIRGTHEVEDGEEYRGRTVSESVRVSGDVAVDEITATYRNGVLEVTLPVQEESSDEYRIDVE